MIDPLQRAWLDEYNTPIAFRIIQGLYGVKYQILHSDTRGVS